MIRVASPPAKPLLIFDGDCGFCRRWIERWKLRTGDRVDYAASQEVAAQFPEISADKFAESVVFIETDGSAYDRAEAVFRSLDRQWMYRLPGVRPVSERVYGFIARHRRLASALTPAIETNLLSRWIFLRALGVIWLIAFVSLWTQIDGLVGSNGILPATRLMNQAEAGLDHNGFGMYWLLPTLCWFNSSDAMLHFLCWGGVVLSLLVIAGVATAPALFGCWLFYLSLSVVCDVFLGYQWDALLLEVGLLAIFFAPWQLTPRLSRQSPPPRLALWLLRWLLFRLMFSAGVVKLASNDPAWWNLTALTIHYETQPLPTWIGWYAHQLPMWLQKFSCGAMFAIELAVPFLIFGSRRLRLIAAGAFTFLMVLIGLTGNYCFFNLLAVALCVLLVDDATIAAVGRGALTAPLTFLRRAEGSPPYRVAWRDRVRRWILLPVATVIALITITQLSLTCRLRVHWPKWWIRAYMHSFQSLHPFRSINSYGLFAVMTTTRSEIIIEGSEDGVEWRAYEFKYKPGDLRGRPRFVEPHQPRVDWQMWFAALGSYQSNPWFLEMCGHLLRGTPQVTKLLAGNPFPNVPPRYLRATVYEYHFTDFATRRATGQWWRRESKGLYCPMLSLQR